MTVEHRLAGCQPEPLLAYLKGLGVLRLVAEQIDPTATGHWAPDGFVLSSRLDEEGLACFFLDAYSPTPILSPWNSSSGFGTEGADELGAIERSTLPRLEPFRTAASVARRLLERHHAKEELIAACRAEMPEPALPWIDASVVLAGDRVVYPPLLGTGGNDLRLDFSRNFHQRVLDVVGLAKAGPSTRRTWLDAALDGIAVGGLLQRSPGQFDAGAAGAPNSAPSGAAEGLLNPWDWVLMLEGSLLFAAGAARRLASSAGGRAAAPFTVDSSAAGYPTATDGEESRGELWLPLWDRPTSLPEIRRLFAEARADWRGRRAGSGLDLVRATGDLGVDRGIAAFSRHVLVERNGRSTIATAVGRVAVGRRPAVLPLGDLDPWLRSVRRLDNPSAAVEAGVRALERAMFPAAAGRGDLLHVLQAASDLNAAVARSGASREHVRPLHLDAPRWLAALHLEGRSDPELRLAVGLASGRDGDGIGALRHLVAASWHGTVLEPPPVPGLGARPIVDVLAAAHARRAVERRAKAPLGDDGERTEQPGFATGFDKGCPFPLGDVVALASGAIDEARLDHLVRACLLLDIRSNPRLGTALVYNGAPPTLALLGPFFGGETGPVAGPGVDPQGPDDRLAAARLVPEPAWVAQLVAGQIEAALAAAVRRLRIAGLRPLVGPHAAASGLPGRAGPRLAAALLVPISSGSRTRLLRQACPRPEIEIEADTTAFSHTDTGGTNAQP